MVYLICILYLLGMPVARALDNRLRKEWKDPDSDLDILVVLLWPILSIAIMLVWIVQKYAHDGNSE